MEQQAKKIWIFDSTLRDGAQGEEISFSVQDKLNIVQTLDQLGIDYIEAGNPGSNPKGGSADTPPCKIGGIWKHPPQRGKGGR